MPTDLLVPPTRRLSSLTARALVRADAMGLLADTGVALAGTPEDPRAALGRVLDAARATGIGRALTPPAESGAVADWEGFAADLLDALEASPLPQTEWAGLERLLGPDLLSELVGVSPSSLRRYSSSARSTPDVVAARLHFLALVVGDLAGSYNAFGVRRWFERPRTQLGGAAPAALLTGAWDPNDAGAGRVRELAAALLGSFGAT
jgi:hypothetical protein